VGAGQGGGSRHAEEIDAAPRRGLNSASLIRSICEANDDRQHGVESDQGAFVDSADHVPAFLGRHGDDLVDHDLRRRLEPVRIARLDLQPVERRIGEHGRQKGDENAVGRLEPVGLNDDGRAGLAVVPGAETTTSRPAS